MRSSRLPSRTTGADSRVMEQEAMNAHGAAQGPSTAPISDAENAVPAPPQNLDASALGRRTLTTAFVRVGPDGYLTVKLRDGRTLILRNIVMRPNDYCGRLIYAKLPGTKYCGSYADVAIASPGAPIDVDSAISARAIGVLPVVSGQYDISS